MSVDGLDLPFGRMDERTRRVVDHAVDEAHRWGHAELTGAHLFIGFIHVEWHLLVDAIRYVGRDPQDVVMRLRDALRRLPSRPIALAVPHATHLTVKLAWRSAQRAGRTLIEPCDLLVAVLEDRAGLAAAVLHDCDIIPDALATVVVLRARELKGSEEALATRYALPETLSDFAVNLNLLARQGKVSPVFGRDRELQQIVEALLHRNGASSVMLLGEPGVGKTAVVEGLAHLLANEPDRLPLRLRECQVVRLQISAIVAGTPLRGMFEERMHHLLDELEDRPDLIVFIDEAHTLTGAGTAVGAPADAANILKPVLARGEIRVIAATTLAEYKQHVSDDEALVRRFRAVHIVEPTVDETRRILTELRPRLERRYGVRVDPAAIETALELSQRYVRHLRLPDKVIGWMNTAAVRTEIDARAEVRSADVMAVVADAAQVPLDMVVRDVTTRFADLEARLQQRVIGQRAAVAAVARRVLVNKGPLKDGFDRPDGVLLFLGPSGVGKTELAKALAEVLFGSDRKMVRVDMSECQDPVAVDKLIGMPRGTVGSHRGGTLTSQLRDHPCSVLLLDEVEKAHPSVLNLFLQAFDEGWLTDGHGKRVHLSDTVIVMTSNVGAGHFRKLTTPFGFLAGESNLQQVEAAVRHEAKQRFTPEFLNRIDEVVLFSPLSAADTHIIAAKYLSTIEAALSAAGKTMHVHDSALDLLVQRGCDQASGARLLKREIDNRIKVPITTRWNDADHFDVRVQDGEVVVHGHRVRMLTQSVA